MNALKVNFLGQSKYWWVVLTVGILMVLCGFAYWLWPVIGFAVSSQIFGWLLVLAAIVQLCVAAGPDHARGRGWWIVSGIINMFVGFMLVRSVILSEAVFPYFIALVLMVWGVCSIVAGVENTSRKYWWLYLINGILLMILGFFFIEAGWIQNMEMTSFLVSLAFIYWGFSIAAVSYDLRPQIQK